MIALSVALVGLFVGPFLLRVGRRSSASRAAVDGLSICLVVGASAIWLLPHAFSHGGIWALLGFVVGVAGPLLAHRVHAERRWTLAGLTVLGVHVVLDGAALAVADVQSSLVVGVAVAAHRIPVGLAVAYRSTSQARAALALSGLGALTVLGFAMGSTMPVVLSESAHGALEALIVGVLLHVVLDHEQEVALPVHGATHFSSASRAPLVLAPASGCAIHGPSCSHGHLHPHGTAPRHEPAQHHGSHAHHGHPGRDAPASALGVLLGIALLLASRAAVAPRLAPDHIDQAGQALLSLSLSSAPAILMGFLFAGLASALIQPVHVQGGGRVGQAVRGVLFGLPLPICSCGVVPMYQSLVQRGVPVTAGLAFLVATPELGLDAVLLSVPLLGVPLTVARVVAAVLVALAVAWLVAPTAPPRSAEPPPQPAPPALARRIREGLRYGLVELVDHTLPWVLLGLGVAALAEPLVDHQALGSVPPTLQVPLAAVVGVPLYVCASGATPLAAVAIHKGLSAGAALTFLLAGPASNLTTFGVLSRLHGRSLALRFGAVLSVAAVLVGWAVDWIGVEVPAVAHPGSLDTHGPEWAGWACLTAMTIIALASLFRMGARGVLHQILSPVHDH